MTWELRNLQEQVNKAFCYQKLFDLSLFEQIVLVISKSLQILCLQPQSLQHSFLKIGQNNFGNKIPLFTFALLPGEKNSSMHHWQTSKTASLLEWVSCQCVTNWNLWLKVFSLFWQRLQFQIPVSWVQNIFFSPLIPSKREKNVLVLLSLHIFGGKVCILFNFWMIKFTIM